MTNLKNDVYDKLKEYGIPIENIKSGDNVIYTKEFVIALINDIEISISFHVATLPDKAATIVLILSEIEGISIDVAEVFAYDSDNNQIISGNLAAIVHKTSYEKTVILNFVEQQQQLQALVSYEGTIN